LHDTESGPEPLHMESARRSDAALGRALALVRYLRAHCPWDARQDPWSLRPYLLEEAHETADAIVAGDDDALRVELGDLLLNVAFQIVLGEERHVFGAEDVVEALETKMRGRHPHVYGEADHPPDWEKLKAEERNRGDHAAVRSPHLSSDPFAGVPAALEPLDRAMRIQERAAGLNFDWPDVTGALAKVREEVAELERELPAAADSARKGAAASARVVHEVGDLLFAAVNVARLAGLHPYLALATATARFESRFERLLELAEDEGVEVRSASLDALEALWERAKAAAATTEETSATDPAPTDGSA
jgi:ATP diphosphatase